jgi:hypothetical protein
MSKQKAAYFIANNKPYGTCYYCTTIELFIDNGAEMVTYISGSSL